MDRQKGEQTRVAGYKDQLIVSRRINLGFARERTVCDYFFTKLSVPGGPEKI